MPTRTDHEDELLVVSVRTEVWHRCKLCGREVRVEYVPGDYIIGDRAASEGYRGAPLLPKT